MPSSSSRKQQPPELVELAPGVAIPDAFSSMFPMPEGRGSWTVVVRTDPAERVPRLVDLSLHFSIPPAGHELTDERMRALLEHAVADKAAKVAASKMVGAHRFAVGEDFAQHFPDVKVPEGTPVLDSAELRRVSDAAAATTRAKPGRRPVSDEDKLHTLELYQAKGLAETMRVTGLAESTIRHRLTEARKLQGPS